MDLNSKKRTCSCIVLAIYLIFYSLFTLAMPENLRFRHFMLKTQPSVGEVLAFEHDKYGFIWTGGRLGLARYDGKTFKIYHHSPDQPGSIPSNSVNDIVTDQRGQLWIATTRGLARFDETTESFHSYYADGSSNSLNSNLIYRIKFDNHGNMWLATREGLNKYDPHTDRFIKYPREKQPTIRASQSSEDNTNSESAANNVQPLSPSITTDKQYIDPKSLYTPYTMDISQHNNGKYYIGTGYGLKVWDPIQNTVEHYQTNSVEPHGLPANLIRNVTIDSHERIWLATEKGLVQFIEKEKKFVFYPTDKDIKHATHSAAIWDILEDIEGKIWVATDGYGLGVIDHETQELTTYTPELSHKDSISSDVLRRIYQDKLGDIWIGAYPNGINVFERYSSAFQLIRKSDKPGKELNESRVSSLYEFPDGTLWIGTEGGGINYYDSSTNEYKTITHNRNDPHSLSSNVVIDINSDTAGNIWVATWKAGVSVYNTETAKFTHYDHNPDDSTSLSDSHAWDVFETTDKYIWVATIGGGLNRFDPTTKTFKRYLHNIQDPHSVADNSVWALIEDKNQTLWVATENGLSRYNKSTDNFTNYMPSAGENSISSERVLSLHVDSQNVLWIGTHGGGLNRFDGVQFSVINEDNGLLSNVVNAIIEDDNQTLWISSDNGISSYNKITRETKNFTSDSGAIEGQFNRNAALRARNGDMVFGGKTGVTRFNPAKISQNKHIPSIVITEIKVQGKAQKNNKLDDILTTAPYLTKAITLKHSQNLLSISYAALNFRNPNKNEYAYTLEGFDTKWHEVGNETKATYTNLDPGKYTFKVRGSNNDGVWNLKGTTLEITVIPPKWLTWWAYTIYILALLGLVAGYLASLKQTNKKLEQEVQNRTKALTNANLRLEKQVVVDRTTGLANKRLLQYTVSHDAAASSRSYEAKNNYSETDTPEKNDIVFYIVECNHIEELVQKYGLSVANQIIGEISDLLLTLTRDSDYLIRWKNNQFIIISRHLSRFTANILAERIKQTLTHTEFNPQEKLWLKIDCAIGFACYPFNTNKPYHYSWQNTIDYAEFALETAKLSGQGNWVGLLSTNQLGYSTSDIRQFALQKQITIETSLNFSSQIQWAIPTGSKTAKRNT